MPPVDPKAGRVHPTPSPVDQKPVEKKEASAVAEGEKSEKETIADKARKLLRTHLSPGKKMALPSQKEGMGPKSLPVGQRGRFPVKSPETWKMFFVNVLHRGSVEKTVSREARSLVEGSFRGVYPHEGNNTEMIVVSDLHFSEEGKTVQEKFARILLPKPEAKNLEKLTPGDAVDTRELASKTGEKLEYVQIVHTPAIEATVGAGVLLSQLKNPSNQGAQARMEKRLLEKRPSLTPWIPFGGDPRPEREKRPGKPRLWTFLSYTIALFAALILIYTIFRLIF